MLYFSGLNLIKSLNTLVGIDRHSKTNVQGKKVQDKFISLNLCHLVQDVANMYVKGGEESKFIHRILGKKVIELPEDSALKKIEVSCFSYSSNRACTLWTEGAWKPVPYGWGEAVKVWLGEPRSMCLVVTGIMCLVVKGSIEVYGNLSYGWGKPVH